MIDDLKQLLAAIKHADQHAVDLREARAAAVARLRAEGWTLQRIATEVGRTKQTVEHWGRRITKP